MLGVRHALSVTQHASVSHLVQPLFPSDFYSGCYANRDCNQVTVIVAIIAQVSTAHNSNSYTARLPKDIYYNRYFKASAGRCCDPLL